MRFALRSAIPAIIVIACLAAPASASKQVIGSGMARQCYLDAENQRATRFTIAGCTEALTDEALTPEDVVASHVNRGILYMQIGDYDVAMRDFDEALQLDPNEPEAYLNKALALFRTEDRWRDSLPLFDIAIEKKTRKPEVAYFARGLANEMAGNIREAYNDLRTAAQIAPKWEAPPRELARYSVRPKSGT
ncbi:tetratricopeptide repeat protein [Sphingomonas sp. LaA6.9]|uniref:tetratricopeptide repeat protein n=1 Tax=Sphingomonas sp. LaA6.9 TaxID=2919914 RepID=UPI001F500F1F|nr:tetratricopeptide repeat protein [Sphingomonas sp. LaA6.9]MCJ8157829.1 tetratricopeptide repeat protein [Sphingomonas sp. LaA6.9]